MTKPFIDPKKFTPKVALFQSISHGFISVMAQPDYYTTEADLEKWSCGGDYIRLSEWTQINLAPLSNAKLTEAALNALAAERARLVDEFTAKLSKVDERIQNLRCLTGPSTDIEEQVRDPDFPV